MSSPDVTDLVENVERVLQKCFVISAPLKDIEKGIVNQRRRMIVYLVVFISFVDFLLSIIRTFASKNSFLHIYSLNSLVSFGYLGRLFNAAFMVGYAHGNHSHVYSASSTKREERWLLLRILPGCLTNFRIRQQKKQRHWQAFYKCLHTFRMLTSSVSCPAMFLRAVGAFAAVKLYGLTFFWCYIPVWLMQSVCATLATHIFSVVHLLIAQSVAYLTLRLKRVDAFLFRVVLMDPNQRSKCKLSSDCSRNASWIRHSIERSQWPQQMY